MWRWHRFYPLSTLRIRSAQLCVLNSLGPSSFSRSQCQHSLVWVGDNGTAKVQRLFIQLWTDNQLQWISQLSLWLCLRRLVACNNWFKEFNRKKEYITLGEFRHVILLSGRQTKSSDRGGKRQKLADFNEVCHLFQRFLFTSLWMRAVLIR